MDDHSLAALLAELSDDVRGPDTYSPEISAATADLLAATSDADRARILGSWLEEHQPCIFGKMASREAAIAYSFLTDSDLSKSDLHIRGRIAADRLEWRRRALAGMKHAFLIVAISKRIAYAQPNAVLMQFALKLGGLYLKSDGSLDPNAQYHDELMLRQGDTRRRWRVGVNYFSMQGDGRWWHDHRIPGGMAFSMNSVGHMARCVREGKRFRDADDIGGLLWALTGAMTLIDNTKAGVSGRDTWLLSNDDVQPTVTCPFPSVPAKLAGKNFCQYGGLYHTDETVPAEYFDPAAERPDNLPVLTDLDLTYLHDDSPANPDFRTTGLGETD